MRNCIRYVKLSKKQWNTWKNVSCIFLLTSKASNSITPFKEEKQERKSIPMDVNIPLLFLH